jgi:hypothetical protein
MEDVRNRAFGPQAADASESLVIAQNLARLYSDVLEEPLPRDLALLIGRLEERMGSGRGGANDRRRG